MSTRSHIIRQKENGTAESIYCHWDGYPEGVGRTLTEHYTRQRKIKRLFKHGGISSLRKHVGRPHDFDNYGQDSPQRVNGWTTFYRRDRGEDDWANNATEYRTVQAALDAAVDNGAIEFAYVHLPGMGWLVYDVWGSSPTLLGAAKDASDS